MRFCGQCAAPLGPAASTPKFAAPETYTPRHLAEKILTSRSALEGERKQVTGSSEMDMRFWLEKPEAETAGWA